MHETNESRLPSSDLGFYPPAFILHSSSSPSPIKPLFFSILLLYFLVFNKRIHLSSSLWVFRSTTVKSSDFQIKISFEFEISCLTSYQNLVSFGDLWIFRIFVSLVCEFVSLCASFICYVISCIVLCECYCVCCIENESYGVLGDLDMHRQHFRHVYSWCPTCR